MSDEFLGDCRQALENEFFQKKNEALLQELRRAHETEERREALQAVSGIQSLELIEALLELDIGPDTFAALTLLPLVLVSWADGVVGGKERDAILKAAREALRGETIERSRAVAKATGGFLGFGNKISDEEESVLTDLEAAFSGS